MLQLLSMLSRSPESSSCWLCSWLSTAGAVMSWLLSPCVPVGGVAGMTNIVRGLSEGSFIVVLAKLQSCALTTVPLRPSQLIEQHCGPNAVSEVFVAGQYHQYWQASAAAATCLPIGQLLSADGGRCLNRQLTCALRKKCNRNSNAWSHVAAVVYIACGAFLSLTSKIAQHPRPQCVFLTFQTFEICGLAVSQSPRCQTA